MVCGPTVRFPPRLAELVLVVALVAGGTWLRWIHLGTPSLWWDEIVHVRIANQPTVTAVWRAVRDGAAPGTGNAGAVAFSATGDIAAVGWAGRHYKSENPDGLALSSRGPADAAVLQYPQRRPPPSEVLLC